MFKNRVRTLVMTLALGLGVWTLAFTYQDADFQEGDVLSAAELNNLLNDNFDAAATAVGDLDARVDTAENDIDALESAMDDKIDRGGDALTGQYTLRGDAADVSGEGQDAVFYVANERTGSDTGVAALFSGNSGDDDGVVSIKNAGDGPVLTLKSGGGPLIAGASGGEVTFAVNADGTVTNAVGSGLPLAFGGVATDGSIRSGTDNWEVTASGNEYRISIDDESYHLADYTTVVTPNTTGVVSARTSSVSGDLLVQLFDADGTQTTGAFHFVTYVVSD